MRERNISVWLPLMHSSLGTRPATQACAPTGNPTSDPLVHRLAFNPLSHTSQGLGVHFKKNYQNWLFSCAAILILTMEENKQHFWHIMLYYFKKGKNSTEMQRKICAVYGESAVTDQC